MPGVPGGDPFYKRFGMLDQMVRGMATQQQDSITNLQGESVLNFGLIPGSEPPEYGIQLVNPSTGAEVGFLGEDSSGTPALRFSNAGGQVQTQLDVNGLHFYDTSGNEIVRVDGTGLHVYNASGTEEVAAGLINASPAIYGLGVLPYGGTTLQMVGGASTAGPGSLSTSSTSPTSITGTTVTTEVGPSGSALVTICGSVEMNGQSAGGGYAYMGVSIDGASATNWVNNQTNLGSAQITESLSASRVVTGLTAGSHTFTAEGWIGSSGVSSGVYGNVYVTVQPL